MQEDKSTGSYSEEDLIAIQKALGQDDDSKILGGEEQKDEVASLDFVQAQIEDLRARLQLLEVQKQGIEERALGEWGFPSKSQEEKIVLNTMVAGSGEKQEEAKGILLTYYQCCLGKELPEFVTVMSGPDHEAEFHSIVDVRDLFDWAGRPEDLDSIGRGYGSRRISAESMAALNVVLKIRRADIRLPVEAREVAFPSGKDPCSMCNVLHQRLFGRNPTFVVGNRQDDGLFHATVEIASKKFSGAGLNKKLAKQVAARKGTAHMQRHSNAIRLSQIEKGYRMLESEGRGVIPSERAGHLEHRLNEKRRREKDTREYSFMPSPAYVPFIPGANYDDEEERKRRVQARRQLQAWTSDSNQGFVNEMYRGVPDDGYEAPEDERMGSVLPEATPVPHFPSPQQPTLLMKSKTLVKEYWANRPTPHQVWFWWKDKTSPDSSVDMKAYRTRLLAQFLTGVLCMVCGVIVMFLGGFYLPVILAIGAAISIVGFVWNALKFIWEVTSFMKSLPKRIALLTGVGGVFAAIAAVVMYWRTRKNDMQKEGSDEPLIGRRWPPDGKTGADIFTALALALSALGAVMLPFVGWKHASDLAGAGDRISRAVRHLPALLDVIRGWFAGWFGGKDHNKLYLVDEDGVVWYDKVKTSVPLSQKVPIGYRAYEWYVEDETIKLKKIDKHEYGNRKTDHVILYTYVLGEKKPLVVLNKKKDDVRFFVRHPYDFNNTKVKGQIYPWRVHIYTKEDGVIRILCGKHTPQPKTEQWDAKEEWMCTPPDERKDAFATSGPVAEFLGKETTSEIAEQADDGIGIFPDVSGPQRSQAEAQRLRARLSEWEEMKKKKFEDEQTQVVSDHNETNGILDVIALVIQGDDNLLEPDEELVAGEDEGFVSESAGDMIIWGRKMGRKLRKTSKGFWSFVVQYKLMFISGGLITLGLILYLATRLYKRRKMQNESMTLIYGDPTNDVLLKPGQYVTWNNMQKLVERGQKLTDLFPDIRHNARVLVTTPATRSSKLGGRPRTMVVTARDTNFAREATREERVQVETARNLKNMRARVQSIKGKEKVNVPLPVDKLPQLELTNDLPNIFFEPEVNDMTTEVIKSELIGMIEELLDEVESSNHPGLLEKEVCSHAPECPRKLPCCVRDCRVDCGGENCIHWAGCKYESFQKESFPTVLAPTRMTQDPIMINESWTAVENGVKHMKRVWVGNNPHALGSVNKFNDCLLMPHHFGEEGDVREGQVLHFAGTGEGKGCVIPMAPKFYACPFADLMMCKAPRQWQGANMNVGRVKNGQSFKAHLFSMDALTGYTSVEPVHVAVVGNTLRYIAGHKKGICGAKIVRDSDNLVVGIHVQGRGSNDDCIGVAFTDEVVDWMQVAVPDATTKENVLEQAPFFLRGVLKLPSRLSSTANAE